MTSKYFQCRFKSFQDEINFSNLNLDIFKEFLILIEFGGKLGKLGKFTYFASSDFCKTQVF